MVGIVRSCLGYDIEDFLVNFSLLQPSGDTGNSESILSRACFPVLHPIVDLELKELEQLKQQRLLNSNPDLRAATLVRKFHLARDKFELSSLFNETTYLGSFEGQKNRTTRLLGYVFHLS